MYWILEYWSGSAVWDLDVFHRLFMSITCFSFVLAKMSPRWAKMNARQLQDEQRWVQDELRWPQMRQFEFSSGFITVLNRFLRLNKSSRWARMSPRWAKMSPRWAKMAPRWAKMSLRWLQDEQRWGQDELRWAKISQIDFCLVFQTFLKVFDGQDEPRWAQDEPKMSQDESNMS